MTIATLLNCTRASSGYYQKADGTLVSFGNDVLRNGTNGLLIEGPRTNLALQSQTFGTTWVTGSRPISVSSNTALAPDGTLTADTIGNDSIVSGAYYIRQNINLVNGTQYTSSFYLKLKNGSGKVWIVGLDDGAFCYFNLTTGLVEQMTSFDNAYMEVLADGWYRCVATYTATSTSAQEVGFGFYRDVGNPNYVPAAVGVDQVYAWGGQHEIGPFASSYIPTTTTSATREADQVSFNSVSFVTPGVGSIAIKYTPMGTLSNGVGIFTINGGAANRVDARMDGEVLFENGTVTQADLNPQPWPSLGVTNTLCLAYNTNSFAAAANGGIVQTDSAGFPPTIITALRFGTVDGGGGNYLFGYIKEFRYFNTRLSNTLVAATAPSALTATETTNSIIFVGDSFLTDRLIPAYIRVRLKAATGKNRAIGIIAANGGTLVDQAAALALNPVFFGWKLVVYDGGLSDSTANALTSLASEKALMTQGILYYTEPSPNSLTQQAGTASRIAHDATVDAIHLAYPTTFIPMLVALQSYNDGSPQDLLDIAENLVPASERSDEIHFNAHGDYLAGFIIMADRLITDGF